VHTHYSLLDELTPVIFVATGGTWSHGFSLSSFVCVGFDFIHQHRRTTIPARDKGLFLV
jgi:hypothetical protein